MKKRLIVDIDADLHSEVKSRAYKQGKTVKEIVVMLLTKWAKENG